VIGTGPSHPSTWKLDGALTTTWKPSPVSTQKQDDAEQPGSVGVPVLGDAVQALVVQSYVHCRVATSVGTPPSQG
jgi:hypothetical protein